MSDQLYITLWLDCGTGKIQTIKPDITNKHIHTLTFSHTVDAGFITSQLSAIKSGLGDLGDDVLKIQFSLPNY
jgi:hypothetical protein